MSVCLSVCVLKAEFAPFALRFCSSLLMVAKLRRVTHTALIFPRYLSSQFVASH